MLGEGSKQKDGRRLVVTSGSLERKKEWLEHLKKRIFKMTLPKMTRDQNEFEAETTMSKQSGTLFHVKHTFTDDDENVMLMKAMFTTLMTMAMVMMMVVVMMVMVVVVVMVVVTRKAMMMIMSRQSGAFQ